ncbi:hypothetical protein J1N35_037416 [Gossypium stocksii]|uniref:Uncharacterized protein n=1 Tax=Gossypium stocksii TaxID=47602 RepID=A0A9D3UJZ5_9ROSI|nr:hypothetical protein J1N35_037416 [Gossypium stocksii]
MRDCPKLSKLSIGSKEVENEPKSEALKLGSMIHSYVKAQIESVDVCGHQHHRSKLAKDVPCGGNINLVDQSTAKTHLEMLEG